jgi:hypothetical protein
MSETTRRPGDIQGEMICVAQVDEFEAILGIMPEHEAAVLAVQKWVNDIQAFDLQDTFGTEEGFWEVMERLGYYADKEPSHGVRPYPKAGVTRFEYLRRF